MQLVVAAYLLLPVVQYTRATPAFLVNLVLEYALTTELVLTVVQFAPAALGVLPSVLELEQLRYEALLGKEFCYMLVVFIKNNSNY